MESYPVSRPFFILDPNSKWQIKVLSRYICIDTLSYNFVICNMPALSIYKCYIRFTFQGLYNEALQRNYNLDETVTVPIIDDLSQEKLKEALQKYNSPNAIIVRNQGIFIWAEDWQKCRAA